MTATFSMDQVRERVRAAAEGGSYFVLEHAAAAEVLRLFVAGSIDREGLVEWAEFFDFNEQVEYESDEVLPRLLFEMSSPEINGWPDVETAERFLTLLSRSTTTVRNPNK